MTHPFPARELTLPPTNRVNIGVNLDGKRLLAAVSLNYSDKGAVTRTEHAVQHSAHPRSGREGTIVVPC
jgi:hypothetical protein